MENNKPLYNVYSQYLIKKYREKVYKIPINLPVSCPNRDGNISIGGCTYCGEEGTGFENLSNQLSIQEQLKRNMAYISKKYKANKFIAYFQSFSNTYMPLDRFIDFMKEACIQDVVELSISTRPDCIIEEQLVFLKELSQEKNVNITIELGLQTANYHTLKRINRGHSLAEFIDGVLRIKKYGFKVCCHLILNLPWDQEMDVIESAKIVSALGIDFVKLHSLYIEKNTLMGEEYLRGELTLLSKEDYINRVILFLEYLSPEIVIQRLIGRAPEENTIFANWNTSWWRIRDQIQEEMKDRLSYQGKHFDYLNGSAMNIYHKVNLL